MPLPIFVINLPRHEERRVGVLEELARVGLSGEVVPGVDVADLTEADWSRYDGRRARSLYGVDMLPTELGCYLAHERALSRVVERDLDAALILEDDIRLDDGIAALLESLVTGPRSWDVARLATTRPRQIAKAVSKRGPSRRLTESHGLYRLNTHVLGALGYVVSAQGAGRILAYGRRIVLPWDHMMDRYWENGIDPYVVYPCPVTHRDELPSAIGERDPRRRYQQGAATLWRRRMNRWRDGIGKRWYALRHR